MMDDNPDIDFIVDIGPSVAEPSTVIDMTGAVPEVLRHGKGSVEPFEIYAAV
jgi:tRNA A37 threonylcarbamoyladenosine synthetase subunit TsaC/SUA5/YrdC